MNIGIRGEDVRSKAEALKSTGTDKYQEMRINSFVLETANNKELKNISK